MSESENEFAYSESEDFGSGYHRQTIIYKGKEIGFLVSVEKNWLAPIRRRLACIGICANKEVRPTIYNKCLTSKEKEDYEK